MLVAILNAFGFQAEAVADGRAALELFRDNPERWTMVVIDLLMPGMTGEQTLNALQVIKPDVRVLLISGFTEGEVIDRVRARGGHVAFLAKPFKHDAFERALRDLMS